MSRAQNYRLLARYYDQFFTFHQYGYHLARKELLGSILPQVSSACDLACGTGTTAVELALMGIQMFAVDFSSTMCRLTRERAAKAGVALRAIRGDMRSFRLPEQVDLITNSHEIRQSLRAAGFNCVRAQDATPFFQGEWKAQPGCRTFYLAEKL